MSQLELALEAGVSTRHLSFVETGRSRPSAEMVLHLADRLEVPLRERNELLWPPASPRSTRPATSTTPPCARSATPSAACWPPTSPTPPSRWTATGTSSPPTRRSARSWTAWRPSCSCRRSTRIRLALHPDGVAPRILNLGEYRADLHRASGPRRRGSPATRSSPSCATRCSATPGPSAGHGRRVGGPGGGGRAAAGAGPGERRAELSFFSTITTFGTAVDVTVSELALEAFFPADDQTAAFLRT